MTLAAGDLGGGGKAQGSGDAGMAGQAQAGQTSQGLSAPGREPNSRSGALTTVTLAIQVAAQIRGGYRATAATSGFHAARLALRRMSEPSADSALVGAQWRNSVT
jgi:hypothetical protein